jgi:hypothetical protein
MCFSVIADDSMLRSGMVLRTALVVPVLVAVSLGAVALALVVTRQQPVAAPPCAKSVVAVAVPATPSAAPAAAPAQAAYVRPVGDQYLGSFGKRLAANADAPPHWFLLSTTELQSYRYREDLPRLGAAMAKELGAVLDEGCRGHSCTAEVEHARASLRSFVDDDQSTRTFEPPRSHRWVTEEDVPEDHRRIDITGRLGATTFDVTCTCTSWTIGMGMWNDLASCEAMLHDHGRTLLRYAPKTELGSGKEPIFWPLDAYEQKVTFASGATLTIESGYSYEGDGAHTPYVRGAPRGSLTWATADPPR